MGIKKLQKNLDTLKGDVRELVEAFWALRDEVMRQQAVSAAEKQWRPVNVEPIPYPETDRLAGRSGDGASPGHVQSFGYYEMPDATGQRQLFHWALKDHPVDEVLSLPVDDAAKLLAAIGHKQRLAIVLLLLRGPATASKVVQTLSLGTTGAAYHHLNVLQGNGLVHQEQRGVFAIVPEQVPSLISVMASLSDVIETSVETVAKQETAVPAGDNGQADTDAEVNA